VDPHEADLLAKARGGNLFAFEEIVKRYQRRVYGAALRIVRRHEVADDVAQEAFMPRAPGAPHLRPRTAVRSVGLPDRGQPRDQPPPLPPGPRRAAARGPSGDALVRGGTARGPAGRRGAGGPGARPRGLPDEQRAVFTLRVFEDLSYKEIADALSINLGTVMSRLSRARERLRAEIASYLGPAGLRAEGRR
jgi:RNA polymerase sigma-70 factor (ECF subfamily)